MATDTTQGLTRSPVAVVTGGARGIGAAVARRLAREGMAVGIIDVLEAEGAATAGAIVDGGGSALAIAADVSDEREVTEAVDRIAADLGPPVVVVNNAGFGRVADLAAMTTQDWDAVMGVGLRGPFFVTRAAVRHMLDAQWGRIVNISSVSALGDSGRVGYATAKAGIIGFTRTLALELGPRGITSNAIAPGFIASDMTAATARRLGHEVVEHQRIAAESVPVRRVGQPDDVAHAVSFLVSRDAGFISGQVLYVAGGPAG